MTKRFDRLLDKATEITLIEPNWDAILDCVDFIRGGEVPLKYGLTSIRKRFHNENPHVAHHALLVLEACVKNCGSKFHAEVATKEFMEDLRHMAMETSTPDKVKAKVLELLQCWATAFRDKADYKIVVDTHTLMKLEGFNFPQLRETEAMFASQCAPDWAEGDDCYRCRTRFGLINRKHHCRCCGQIFCDRCSSRQMHLPHFGIEKAVRVCEACYEKSGKKTDLVAKSATNGETAVTMSETGKKALDTSNTGDAKRPEEDEQLALALAISQSEAEEQERQRQLKLYQIFNGSENVPDTHSMSPSTPSVYKGVAVSDEPRSAPTQNPVDPELARYLNRDYWQQRKADQKHEMTRRQSPTPSAPPPNETSVNGGSVEMSRHAGENHREAIASESTGDSEAKEALEDTAKFCNELKQQVEILENRIRSNQARGRSIVNDSGIQTLFVKLTEMHAAVLARMQTLDDERNYFESLQDQVAHIQEARQAVNALRDDHERRRREQMLEEQRVRQLQMQQKLDLMRHKKHEMLMYQRHQALQRFQQQEHELQMRRMQQQVPVAPPPVPGAMPYAVPAGNYPIPGQMQQQPVQQQQQGYLQQAAHVPAAMSPHVTGQYLNNSYPTGVNESPAGHASSMPQHNNLPPQALPPGHYQQMTQHPPNPQYHAPIQQYQYPPGSMPVQSADVQHQQVYFPPNHAMPPQQPPTYATMPNMHYQHPSASVAAPAQPEEGLLISFD